MCIAVIPCGSDVFFFDSHSRNREGKPNPNGYTVLLKFPDLVAAANYVTSCYCQCNVVQFEAQFIAVHLVEVFFREIILILSRPLSNVKYYTIQVELQIRGSLHIHSFLWLLNPPNIEGNIDVYKKFVDLVISPNIPSLTDDPLIFKFLQTYQISSH